MASTLGFLGRLLFVLVFVGSGAQKLTSYQDKGGPMVGYLASKLEPALAKFEVATGVKVPITQAMYPEILLASGVVEVLGSLLFVAGSSLGAVLLTLFLVPTTVIMHAFWEAPPNSAEQQAEMIHFLKNVALLGALLMFLGTPKAPKRRNYEKEKLL